MKGSKEGMIERW